MTAASYLEPETTKHVVSAFFDVYNTLGFGFLERIYADALEWELLARSRKVQREVLIPIWYKGKQLSPQRVDMIVDDRVVVEVKSTDVLPPNAERQLLNYVRASTISVGMLLHFGPKPRFFRKVHSVKRFPDQAIWGDSQFQFLTRDNSRVFAETSSSSS